MNIMNIMKIWNFLNILNNMNIMTIIFQIDFQVMVCPARALLQFHTQLVFFLKVL